MEPNITIYNTRLGDRPTGRALGPGTRPGLGEVCGARPGQAKAPDPVGARSGRTNRVAALNNTDELDADEYLGNATPDNDP